MSAEGTQMFYRKITVLGIVLTVVLGLAGCKADVGSENGGRTEDKNSVEATEQSVESEEEITLEERLQRDAKAEDIIDIFESFAWEEDSDYRYQKKFSDLKLEMEKLALKNLFAQEFVEVAKSVPYDGYDEVNRLAFDSYVRLLFREGYYEITNGTLGKFQEAWSGDYIEENRLLLYARLEDEKYTSWNNSKYLRIWYDRNEDKVRTDSTVFDLSLQDNSTIQILQGDYFTKDVVAEIELEDIKEQLNKMLETNKGFFDYLMSYRDNVYSPVRNATLSAEKEKKDEQDRIDKELSKKEPKIGMSAEEVKKTKWGYPDKINKDTYAWGTTEQWVYSGKGYVYFENGVVTSISER